MIPGLILPNIITMEEHSHNFAMFNEAAYSVFKQDFILSRPLYQGKKVGIRKYPLLADGKEYTYYHFTHDGNDDANRMPNFRRMERITYPKPIINNSLNPALKVWIKKVRSWNRILLFHDSEDYLVVLEDRVKYILPITAYLVDYENQKRKLLKEYAAYLKAEAE